MFIVCSYLSGSIGIVRKNVTKDAVMVCICIITHTIFFIIIAPVSHYRGTPRFWAFFGALFFVGVGGWREGRTDCRRGGCMVGTRCVGVSRWSYLAPEASDGKVLCGHKPQSKPHLSEPGTHQRTWRVMGRPARQKTQTLSMTRRNDRTRHDHAAAPLADCPFVPPFVPPSPTQKKSPQVQTPRNSPKTQISNYHQSLSVITQHAAETSESPSHWKPSQSQPQDS